MSEDSKRLIEAQKIKLGKLIKIYDWSTEPKIRENIYHLVTLQNIDEKYVYDVMREQGIQIPDEETKKEDDKEDFKNIFDNVIPLISDRKYGVAGEILVEVFLRENFVKTVRDDNKSEIWIYDDGVYVPHGKTYIKEFVRNVLGDYYSQKVAGMVIAKIEVDTYVEQDDFFGEVNKWEVPLLNGVLHLQTKELRQYNPDKDIFFHKLPVKFNPNADCPKIHKHFKTVLKKEEDTTVMYELIGFCLFKEHFIEKAFMFTGSGRNGKGKTLEIIKNLVGHNNACCVPLISMQQESFNLHQMFGKMVNLAGDLNNKDLKETGLFKSLTGRDVVTAHRKFLTDINFVSFAKNIFACNELPRVYDISEGFWSRWVLFEFPYKFVSKEEYEKMSKEEKEGKKIMEVNHIQHIISDCELSGLLNKALMGLDTLLTKKDFSHSKGTAEVKDYWIRKSSPFTAFCFDCVEQKNDGYIAKSSLRKEFNIYRKKHKLKGAGDKEIIATLQDLFGASDDRKVIWPEKQPEYVWEGITLKK